MTELETTTRQTLHAARRVVVKVGSRVLTTQDVRLDARVLTGLCAAIAEAMQASREVVLVSSGAVAFGMSVFGIRDRVEDIAEKQALAAVGQSVLMQRYREIFELHGIVVAQVLLTHSDFADRQRFLHARHVMERLLRRGVLPIVNENDVVAVDEIRFGDNDALSSQVAHVVGADALVLLTEVEGLHTADPTRDPSAARLPFVSQIDDAVLGLAGSSSSRVGTGGMSSKLLAARATTRLGIPVLIAAGKRAGALEAALRADDVGTLFAPSDDPARGKRGWIAVTLRPSGSVRIDAGAVKAIVERGKSLLPSGIVGVEGEFGVGDPVAILDPGGREIARGLAAYASGDLRRIAGAQSSEIEALLGYTCGREAVHRDDLVLE